MQNCHCPYPHKCRRCAAAAPCLANYCSTECYQQDAARNFRPRPPGSPPPAPPPPRPAPFTRIW